MNNKSKLKYSISIGSEMVMLPLTSLAPGEGKREMAIIPTLSLLKRALLPSLSLAAAHWSLCLFSHRMKEEIPIGSQWLIH